MVTRCWPCSSNSVRLGSAPRASKHVGGLRALGRGSGHRASPTTLLLSDAPGRSGVELLSWLASWRRSASGSGSARSPSHTGSATNRLRSDRYEPGHRRDPPGELAAVARAPACGRSRFARRRLGGQRDKRTDRYRTGRQGAPARARARVNRGRGRGASCRPAGPAGGRRARLVVDSCRWRQSSRSPTFGRNCASCSHGTTTCFKGSRPEHWLSPAWPSA